MIRTVLRTEHVTMQFGGVIAVNDLNIVVKEHEIIALIGPNGAGKTTAFNDITGVYTPTKGRVIYTKTNGQEIDIKQTDRKLTSPGKSPARSRSWALPVPSRTSVSLKT